MGRRKGSVNRVDPEQLPRGVTKYQDGRARPFLVRHRSMKPETFSTPEAAVARKKELLELERTEGTAAITYSRAVHADVTEARKILPPGISHTEAARFWMDHHPSTTLHLAKAVEHFLALRISQSVEPDILSRHTKDLKSRLGRFVLSFGEQPLPEITGEAILQWLSEQRTPKGEPLSPRSVANYRVALQNLFNYAARRKWIVESPMDRVLRDDLPTVRSSDKHPLSIDQANTLLEMVQAERPEWLPHFALRLFLGFRTSEANRFRWEWIQRDQGRVYIPAQASKTGDAWSINDVPPRFWSMIGEPEKSGAVPPPHIRAWQGCKAIPRRRRARVGLKTRIVQALELDRWPDNATRDTFCTLHISAYRDPQRTALVLKHRSSSTLWTSYLGTTVAQAAARAFFESV